MDPTIKPKIYNNKKWLKKFIIQPGISSQKLFDMTRPIDFFKEILTDKFLK